MINKILNIWLTGLVILCVFCLTIIPFAAGIVMSIVFNDPLWLLWNLAYIILFPVITLMWMFINEVISSGGLL